MTRRRRTLSSSGSPSTTSSSRRTASPFWLGHITSPLSVCRHPPPVKSCWAFTPIRLTVCPCPNSRTHTRLLWHARTPLYATELRRNPSRHPLLHRSSYAAVPLTSHIRIWLWSDSSKFDTRLSCDPTLTII